MAQARDITRYSLIGSEDEVLLPPGCRFRVESVLPQGDLTLIQLKELPSKEWIADLNPKPNALGAPPAAVAPHPQGGDAAEVSEFLFMFLFAALFLTLLFCLRSRSRSRRVS